MMKCKYCKFWEPDEYGPLGKCHAHSPSVFKDKQYEFEKNMSETYSSVFPRTIGYNWCGDFIKKDELEENPRMKSEGSLQRKLIATHEDMGYYCPHLSPPGHPGFPDLVAIKDGKIKFIEVKDFDKIGDGELMFKIFTDSQPSFYIKRIANNTPVTVIGYDDGFIRYMIMHDLKMIQDLFAMEKREYLSTYSTTIETVSEIVD